MLIAHLKIALQWFLKTIQVDIIQCLKKAKPEADKAIQANQINIQNQMKVKIIK